MIVICPSCSTSYEVDESEFGRRPRTVACTACEARWTQEPAFELPLDEGWPAEPPPDAAPKKPAAPPVDALERAEPVGVADRGPISPQPPAKVIEPLAETIAEHAENPPETTPEPLSPEPADRLGTDVRPSPVVVAPLNPAPGSEAPVTDATADEPQSLRDRLKSAMAAQGEPPPSETADTPPPPAEEVGAVDDATLVIGGHDTEDTVDAPADIDAILSAEAVQFERRERLRRTLLTAAVGAAVLIALLAAVLFARGAIVAHVPAAEVFFAALGMAPDATPEGLEFRDVSKVRDWADGEDALIVTGRLHNGTPSSMPVPAVRIVLLDADEVELQSVVVSLPATVIQAGESLPFEARVESPALAAEHIRLTLVTSH